MKAIYESLQKVQQELKAPKNQYNDFGKYAYRNAEDILEAVKPLLVKYGTVLILSDTVKMVGDRYYIEATATFTDGTDSISNTALAREDENLKGQTNAQTTGSTSSYARKYALNGLFAIDDNKDADTLNDGKKVENTAKTPSKPVEKSKYDIIAELIKGVPLEANFIPRKVSELFGAPIKVNNLTKEQFDELYIEVKEYIATL